MSLYFMAVASLICSRRSLDSDRLYLGSVVYDYHTCQLPSGSCMDCLTRRGSRTDYLVLGQLLRWVNRALPIESHLEVRALNISVPTDNHAYQNITVIGEHTPNLPLHRLDSSALFTCNPINTFTMMV